MPAPQSTGAQPWRHRELEFAADGLRPKPSGSSRATAHVVRHNLLLAGCLRREP